MHANGAPAASSPLPAHDFNLLLHELRTREIRRMPPGARRFLSAGCAGRWYFDWIDQNYPGKLDSHAGVEAYSPCPADLPSHVRWVTNTIGQMHDVADHSVDLVFAGQTVEHVWPPDLADFLLESHRVLAPGGHIVCDSPNRTLTQALAWVQPQHTAELTTSEIVELLHLAGFDDVRVRGIWLCYDRKNHQVLPMLPPEGERVWTAERRATEALTLPEDCFIWWAEARKAGRSPNRDKLYQRGREIYDHVTATTFGRVHHLMGTLSGYGPDRIVTAKPGDQGFLFFGPMVPLQPGAYRARFEVRLEDTTIPTDEPVVLLDLYDGCENQGIAARMLTAGQLRPGRWCMVDVPFDQSEARFGVQVRVQSTGLANLSVRMVVDLRNRAEPIGAGSPVVLPDTTEEEERQSRRLIELLGQMPTPMNAAKPLRYRIADRVNSAIKVVGPMHRLMRRLVG